MSVPNASGLVAKRNCYVSNISQIGNSESLRVNPGRNEARSLSEIANEDSPPDAWDPRKTVTDSGGAETAN